VGEGDRKAAEFIGNRQITHSFINKHSDTQLYILVQIEKFSG